MDSVQSPGFLKQTKQGFQAQTVQETEGEEAMSDKKNQDLPPPLTSHFFHDVEKRLQELWVRREEKKKKSEQQHRRTRAT